MDVHAYHLPPGACAIPSGVYLYLMSETMPLCACVYTATVNGHDHQPDDLMCGVYVCVCVCVCV